MAMVALYPALLALQPVARLPHAPRLPAPRCIAAGGDADDEYLDELDRALNRASAGLESLADVASSLKRSYSQQEQPSQRLLLGTLALLFGFWLAHFTDCVYGQGGYWEYVAGFVALFLSERITVEYYRRPSHLRSSGLRLLNSLKVGFYLGIVLDALKMAG